MLNFLSLFSGIGAFEKALDRLGVEYNLVNYCEIDKYASKSYSAIHNVPESLNLGDITKVNISNLKKCDFIVHGSPCQDFSISGLQAGGDINSGTRSSLIWYSVKIIKHCEPKVVIWENVKNVLSDKHKHNFEKYINAMNDMGYNSYYEILNGTDYNVPQIRERVVVVSIKKEVDRKGFRFIKPVRVNNTFYDFLDEQVDEKYFKYKYFKSKEKYNDEKFNRLTVYKLVENKDKISKRSDGNIFTLTASGRNCGNNQYIASLGRVLTPAESMKLMGFDYSDYEKVKAINMPETQIYKQSGNSIIVDKLFYIFKEILEVLDVKKVEDKVVVYECNDLIDVAALKEKEPELYAELLADYPCENATYVFKNFCN